jgi:hypothetical protein
VNIRSLSGLAVVAVLALVECGCQGLAGVRYHNGTELEKLAAGDALAEVIDSDDSPAGQQPPHSRFHPVPTRPVFTPQVETEPVLSGAVLNRAPEPASSNEADDPVPPPAAEEAPARTGSSVAVAHHVEPAPAKELTAGPSSRKPRAIKSVLLPATASQPQTKVAASEPSPAKETLETEDESPALGDGWRPRVAQ